MRVHFKWPGRDAARKVSAGVVIAACASGLALAGRRLPVVSVPLAKLDDLLYDSMYRLRPMDDQTRGPVVIVAVDQKSLDLLDQQGIGGTHYGWPWPRQFWGRMIGYFNRAGARAIAFDLIFSERSVYNDINGDDEAFARISDGSKVPVVFGSMVRPDGMPGRFAPPVRRPLFGAVNVGDSVIYRDYQPNVFGVPSLASRAVAAAGGKPFGGPFRLHYYGPDSFHGRRTFRCFSAGNVLAASIGAKNTGVEPSDFKDKIVLIGAVVAGTYDLKASPLSDEYPGVEVQATAVANMLFGRRVLPAPTWANLAAAFLAAMAAAVGVVFPRRASIKLLAAAGTVSGLLVAAGLMFAGRDIRWLPLAAPLAAALLATIAAFAWSYLIEDRERRFILKALGQYVSPQVAAELARNKDALRLGGERREMTVMFTDIQGFTALSETLEDQKLTGLLNYYLDQMSSLVWATNGTIDKYIGDAIMSFWNAPLAQPDHAALACRSALAMERREREIQPALREFGADGLLTRIGINTGPMVFGNMGSSEKFNYSVLGDSVNLGSRLEGANKFYGSRILVAQSTAERVREQFVLRQLDVLRVSGKQKPMAVYELMAEGDADDELAFRRAEYESAFASYLRQAWEEAEARLAGLLARFPSDLPAAALLGRARALKAHPPAEGWDGVYVAKGK